MQDPDAKQRSLNKYNKVFWINLKKIALHLLIKKSTDGVCSSTFFGKLSEPHGGVPKYRYWYIFTHFTPICLLA